LAIIDAAKEWPKFLNAMDLNYLNENEKFSSFKKLNSNFHELYKILEDVFIRYSLTEVIDKLRDSGVTFGFMNKSNDLASDQQFLDSGVLIKYENEAFEEDTLTVNSPVFLKNEPKKTPAKGPDLGEHTKEILISLGKSEADISALKESGIIDF
jgi:crotonobetainyl-CoA:carnitine CoA-transferase CaiB-like acyl-CoA transferase